MTCRVLKFLITLRAISAQARFAMQAWVIRFAHPSGRTELRALLRCATFLQQLRSYPAPETSAFTFKLCCTFLTGFALRRIRKTGFHLYPDRLVTVLGWAQARENHVSITRYYRHGRHQCGRP